MSVSSHITSLRDGRGDHVDAMVREEDFRQVEEWG